MTLVDPDDYKDAPDNDAVYSSIKMKTPKRILHFSDGILEEYSDDEVDCAPKEEKAVVDPSSLTWGPWLWYKAWTAGSTTVSVVDNVGEFMASALGITTPKYYFELQEYKKRNSEAVAQQEQERGWSQPSGFAPQNVQLNEINLNRPEMV